MGFHIKFDDVQSVDVYARSKLAAMQDRLGGIVGAIEDLVGADGFEGTAASKAKSYLSDVHGILYASIGTILVEYQQLLLLYKDGYHTTVDSDPHAQFDEDRLSNLETEVSRRVADFEAEAAELESAVDSVSDLLSFFGPRNGSGVAADIRHIGERAALAREAVGEYEHAHASDLSSVKDQLSNVEAVLDQYLGAHGSLMSSYSADVLLSNPAVVALGEGIGALQAEQEQRAPAMADVYLREEDRTAVLDAEAAAERAKWGWVKAVGAVATITVGVIVIVASAGTATPLVVVGAAGLATVFGASDLVEAGGDIYYGSRGDAYTQAFNPLRDTVFGGNQTLYDITEIVVCAVASAGIPVTAAARLGTLPRGAVAGAVVREGAEDIATQKIAELAAPHLGAGGAMVTAMVAGSGMGHLSGGAKVPDASAGRAPIVQPTPMGRTPMEYHHGGYSRKPPKNDLGGLQEWAEVSYAELRRDPDLVDEIAGSTGWSRVEIQQVTDHLLRNEQLLDDYESGGLVRRAFDPDPYQAEALLRLRSGDATPSDMLLLKHEWAESEYLRLNPGATYRMAHEHANTVADWWSEILKSEGT